MAGPATGSGPLDSSTSMPFIISSNADKADPATRKLIRSHAMRGKKKKKVLPRKGGRMTVQEPVAFGTHAERVKLEEVIKMYTPVVPGRVGSDLSFTECAAEIEQSMLMNTIKGSCVRLFTNVGYDIPI